MPLPAITLAGIGSVLSGVSGFLGGKDKSNITNEIMQANYKDQMHNTIRYRVEDAKRAGIHPLYALGASAGPTAPVLMGQSNQGDHYKDGLATAGAAMTRHATDKQTMRENTLIELRNAELHEKQQRALDASIGRDWALAAKHRSDTILSWQQALGKNKMPDMFIPVYDNQRGKTVMMPNPAVVPEPNEFVGTGYWLRGTGMTPPGGSNKIFPTPKSIRNIDPYE